MIIISNRNSIRNQGYVWLDSGIRSTVVITLTPQGSVFTKQERPYHPNSFTLSAQIYNPPTPDNALYSQTANFGSSNHRGALSRDYSGYVWLQSNYPFTTTPPPPPPPALPRTAMGVFVFQ